MNTEYALIKERGYEDSPVLLSLAHSAQVALVKSVYQRETEPLESILKPRNLSSETTLGVVPAKQPVMEEGVGALTGRRAHLMGDLIFHRALFRDGQSNFPLIESFPPRSNVIDRAPVVHACPLF